MIFLKVKWKMIYFLRSGAKGIIDFCIEIIKRQTRLIETSRKITWFEITSSNLTCFLFRLPTKIWLLTLTDWNGMALLQSELLQTTWNPHFFPRWIETNFGRLHLDDIWTDASQSEQLLGAKVWSLLTQTGKSLAQLTPPPHLPKKVFETLMIEFCIQRKT